VPDFRKKIAHFWARMINVVENCNEKKKNFMSQSNLLLSQIEPQA